MSYQFHSKNGKIIEFNSDRLDKFFQDINLVCAIYGLSISHEDLEGAFVLNEYNKENMEWLKNALIEDVIKLIDHDLPKDVGLSI